MSFADVSKVLNVVSTIQKAGKGLQALETMGKAAQGLNAMSNAADALSKAATITQSEGKDILAKISPNGKNDAMSLVDAAKAQNITFEVVGKEAEVVNVLGTTLEKALVSDFAKAINTKDIDAL